MRYPVRNTDFNSFCCLAPNRMMALCNLPWQLLVGIGKKYREFFFSQDIPFSERFEGFIRY
jgi:hypothetical protein